MDHLGRREEEKIQPGAVIHYKAFNTISHGMMLEAPHTDIAAKDFRPEAPSLSE